MTENTLNDVLMLVVSQEVSPTLISDVGLSRVDVHDIQCAWQKTFARAQQAIVAAGGWNWQLFKTTANVITTKTTRAKCDAFYQSSCAANSTMQLTNLYYLFSGTGGGAWFAPTSPFLDIASFLLVRGPYVSATSCLCKRQRTEISTNTTRES